MKTLPDGGTDIAAMELVAPRATDEGVTIHRTSKEILAAQLEAWDKLIPQLEEDPFMKKVLDSQRAWVERVTYYELMNSPDYQLAYDHYFPGKLKL